MKKILTLMFLALSVCVFAQQQVSGVVVDSNGDPIPGASIQAKGTTQGTISDYDGKFEMSVPESVKTLVVSFVGMATQEVAAGKNIRVVLAENTEVIQEIVVTGYGDVLKGTFDGSAQAVKAEDIEKKNPSDVTKALAGEVAGVQVVTSSGQPGTIGSIRIRGIGSISASSSPLYVVDGIPLDAGSISSIDPGDIASTTILKDATATSLYGSRGANGVVLITTKKGSSNGDEGKIEIDVKAGANMRLLPMYDVIDTPEDYVLMAWQSLYGEYRYAKSQNETKSVKYANEHLFVKKGVGLPATYNIWDQAGSVLINAFDAAGNVNPTFDYAGAHRRGSYNDMESWYNTLFHNGLKLEATAKISGGNEKLNYYTSFGYLKDEGYYTASDFQRFNTRANINYQPKKWLKGGLNIQYAYARISNPVQDDEAANNGFLFVQQIPSIYPVYRRDAEGNIVNDPKTGGKMYDYGEPLVAGEKGRPYSYGINPAGALAWDKQQTVRHQTVANAFLEFKLYEGLKFTINAGLQYMNNRINALTNKFYGDAAGIGRVANTQYNYFAFTSNQLLEYSKTFNEHNIRVMAGHETTYYNYNMQYGYKKNIVEDNVIELSNGVSMDGVEGYARTSTLESALATVSYGYDERYHITANYRADGSSKFAKGHRWGHFGSVGASWSFTNEHFMEGTTAAEWIKDGKLRLSWGVLGNQDIGDMLFTDKYNVENVDGAKAYVWSYKGNPDLTWERTSTIDLGLEFGISKYLNIELDYFYKKTDNMLFPRYVAPSLGYGGYYVNDAAMENQGFEFELKAHALDMRNIKLDIRWNGGLYRNKMLQMPIDGYDENGDPVRMVMSGGMSVGHSTADWYMMHYEGVNEDGVATYTAYYDATKGGFGTTSADLIDDGATGDNYISSVYEYKLKHPNADIRETSVFGKQTTYAGSNYVGKSYMPDLDGGFGIDFEAYGVTLSVSCSYRIGGYGYDNNYALLMHNDVVGSRNWHKDMLQAWNENNKGSNIPRLSNGADDYANASSDRFLTSNSFLSLNNINLGYKFPKKLIEKIKLNNLQLWVAADNLAIASARKGYNPMMSFAGTNAYADYSPQSTVMGGIKIQF
jgi:TonB-linked SusC/RagA family outer membrane protein